MASSTPIQRMTRQRQLILDELRSRRDHPTADDIYEAVRLQLPHISLGTVYRNLDVLHRCGAIRKLDMVGSQSRYDGDLQAHAHVRCTQCGRLADAPMPALSLAWNQLSEASGYEVTGYRLEFEGVCGNCQEEKRKGNGPSREGTPRS